MADSISSTESTSVIPYPYRVDPALINSGRNAGLNG
jgi:hypothetical protein